MANDLFRQRIAERIRQAEEKAKAVAEHVALDVLRQVVLRSPVDTGQFRHNWRFAIGGPDTSTTKMTDRDGTATVNEALTVLRQFKLGDVIHISNSLPYAYRLEYGWSKQAPQGMVRLTVQSYPQLLRQAVAAVSTSGPLTNAPLYAPPRPH